MKSLNRNKKGVSAAGLTELDYSVLNYEELLAVNGAKGSSNPTGPSDSSIEINDSDINNNPPSNEPTSKNPIDNTNNPEIVKEFTDRGYELLSDKKDSTYTDGSRKEYMKAIDVNRDGKIDYVK